MIEKVKEGKYYWMTIGLNWRVRVEFERKNRGALKIQREMALKEKEKREKKMDE